MRDPPKPPTLEYVVGLDLGKAQDYTAVSILEVHGDPPEAQFSMPTLAEIQAGRLVSADCGLSARTMPAGTVTFV